MILFLGSMILWHRQPKFQSQLEVLEFQFPIFDQKNLIFEEQMVLQMVLFQCSKSSMILLDMSIKGEEKERVHLLYICSHGTLMFLISSNSKKIQGNNKIGLEICSMDYGSQTSSWKGSYQINSGHWCAQINAQDYLKSGENNLKVCILNINQLEKVEKP